MRKRLKQYKFIILAIFLVAGVSIAGWAFASHYDIKMKSDGSQEESKTDILAAKVMPSALEHSKIILLLVCTGLVGFFFVRRQNNTMKTFVNKKRPEIKLRINLLRQDILESQTCHLWKTGCVAS
jgi:cobalamin-dependent methionine synthase I